MSGSGKVVKYRNKQPGHMAKNVVVVFTESNARVFINPPSIDDFAGYPVVPSPDLKAVAGVPSHYWKLEGANKILPMSATERLNRDNYIKLHGMRDNKIKPMPRLVYSKPEGTRLIVKVAYCVLVALLGALGLILISTIN